MLTHYLSAAVDPSELLLCEQPQLSIIAVLSDIEDFPLPENQTDFAALGLFAWSNSTLGVGKSPLRLIVARTPVTEDLSQDYSTTYYLDTLECGHQVLAFLLPEEGKKRHRCPECATSPKVLKKPSHSVTQIHEKKESA